MDFIIMLLPCLFDLRRCAIFAFLLGLLSFLRRLFSHLGLFLPPSHLPSWTPLSQMLSSYYNPCHLDLLDQPDILFLSELVCCIFRPKFPIFLVCKEIHYLRLGLQFTGSGSLFNVTTTYPLHIICEPFRNDMHNEESRIFDQVHLRSRRLVLASKPEKLTLDGTRAIVA